MCNYNLNHCVSQANGRKSCPPSPARAASVLKTSTRIVRRNEEGLVIYMFPHSTVISPIKITARKCMAAYYIVCQAVKLFPQP